MSNKIFKVSPYKGVSIKNVNNCNIKESNWKNGILEMRDMGKWKMYKIQYYKGQSNLPFIILIYD